MLLPRFPAVHNATVAKVEDSLVRSSQQAPYNFPNRDRAAAATHTMSKYTSTILITGGTTGLGAACAHIIAKERPNSLALVCSRSSGDDAAGKINNATGQSNVQYLALDLADLGGVRSFAASFSKRAYPPVSALILNAGLQFPGQVNYTKDDLESTFGINHVGNAALLYLLMPYLQPDVRVVITSSGTHDPAQKTGLPDAKYKSAELLAYPNAESLKDNNGRQRYATSKLCNVLWTYALDRHIKGRRLQWTVNAMDPGLMPGTGLARDAGPVLRFLWHHVLPRLIPVLRILVSPNVHTVQESGEALARLATGDDAKGVSGKYFEGLREIRSGEDSYKDDKQDDLWKWTASFVGQDPVQKLAFEKLEVPAV